jgi:hypothetical protein
VLPEPQPEPGPFTTILAATKNTVGDLQWEPELPVWSHSTSSGGASSPTRLV